MAEGTTKVFSPLMLLVLDKLFRLTLISNNCKFWHVIHAGGNLFEVRSESEEFTVDKGKRSCSCRMWQLSGIPCVHATKVIFLINRVHESYVPTWFETDMYFVAYHNFVKPVSGMNFWPDQSMYSTVLQPKPKKCLVGLERKESELKVRVVVQLESLRPRKKQSVGDVEDVNVVLKGPVRDEGVGGSRGGASGSRGRGCAGGSKRGASGSRGGGAGVSRGGDGGSRRGASGSKRKPISSDETKKRQDKKKVGTSGFAKWFGLQDEQEQTQDEPQQTRHEPVQTHDEDQVEKTQEQAEIDLTQVEQTQEQTQDQVQPQEQPHQVTLRTPSARILQRKLEKQGSSQNTALNVE
ncbi:multidrug resistance-associated protein 5 [Tanacetum coccineum]